MERSFQETDAARSSGSASAHDRRSDAARGSRDLSSGRRGAPNGKGPRIGVLALQGDFARHAARLRACGAEVCEVRRPSDLEGLAGMILPGGESSTLLRLLRFEQLDDALLEFHRRGGHIFGTCAGLIVLADRVESPEQRSLKLLDVTVRRNAYGRQIDSFVEVGSFQPPGETASPVEMVFIRAPRIVAVGPEAQVAGRLDREPVLVEQGRILAATFHPEMSEGVEIHRYFLDRVRRAAEVAP